MATYLENLERWRRKGEADARKGKYTPPKAHYEEVIRAYVDGHYKVTKGNQG
jgi:hypothetical protein